jgi:PAS domain-containing protein
MTVRGKPKRTKRKEKATKDLVVYVPPPAYVLSWKQERAITFLSRHGYRVGQKSKDGILVECCESVDIGRTTLHKWLKVPAFRQAITDRGLECENALFDYANRAMAGLLGHPPNAALILRFLEVRHPDIWDKQVILTKLKHKHAIELERLRAELKTNPGDEEDYEVRIRETGPGERITQETSDEEDL